MSSVCEECGRSGKMYVVGMCKECILKKVDNKKKEVK